MYIRIGSVLMPDYLCLCCERKIDWTESVYAFAARSSFCICEKCECNYYNYDPSSIYKALKDLPKKIGPRYPEYRRPWQERVVYVS